MSSEVVKKHVLWDYEYTLFEPGCEPYQVWHTGGNCNHFSTAGFPQVYRHFQLNSKVSIEDGMLVYRLFMIIGPDTIVKTWTQFIKLSASLMSTCGRATGLWHGVGQTGPVGGPATEHSAFAMHLLHYDSTYFCFLCIPSYWKIYSSRSCQACVWECV